MGTEERIARAGGAARAQEKGKQGVEPAAKPAAAPQGGFAGPLDDGYLLPNGWRVTPAGKHTVLSDLPLNIIALADNRHALVATSGFNTHHLTLVDLESGDKVNQVAQRDTWFGLALDDKSGNLWWSGGGGGTVHRYHLAGNIFEGIQPALLTPTAPPTAPPAAPPQPAAPPAQPKPAAAPPAGQAAAPAAPKPAAPPAPPVQPPQPDFITGVYADPTAGRLYALTIRRRQNVPPPANVNLPREPDGLITAIPLDGSPTKSVPCGVRPYDVLRGRNGLLYVSDWADRRVLVVDPETLRTLSENSGRRASESIGPAPDRRSAVRGLCVEQSGGGDRHGPGDVVEEVIHTALFPQVARREARPTPCAWRPTARRLYIANADNNCIAVVDVAARRGAAPWPGSFRPAGIRRRWRSRPTASSCWSAWARGWKRRRTSRAKKR